MDLIYYLRARNWPMITGYVFFTGMMAVGYFYNVTFIQLGLVDLGGRVLEFNRQSVAAYMAILALATCLTALATGFRMSRRQRVNTLESKLQSLLAVMVIQTIITALAPAVSSPAGFLAWILICSLALGVGVQLGQFGFGLVELGVDGFALTPGPLSGCW